MEREKEQYHFMVSNNKDPFYKDAVTMTFWKEDAEQAATAYHNVRHDTYDHRKERRLYVWKMPDPVRVYTKVTLHTEIMDS